MIILKGLFIFLVLMFFVVFWSEVLDDETDGIVCGIATTTAIWMGLTIGGVW